MLMITEYCSHGDLLNFLRAHAHDFMASMLSFDEGKGLTVYKNMASVHARLRRCDTPHKAIKPFIRLKLKISISLVLKVTGCLADANVLLFSDSGISCCSDYQEMQPILGRAQQGNRLGMLLWAHKHTLTHI